MWPHFCWASNMTINPQDRAWLLRDKYAGRETADFLADVKRLEEGEPLDYVIGWREFLGCRIDLSERPLIPRMETEWWTESVIEKIGQQPAKVLDIFAGSGCIGLAILKHCPQAEVTFVDSEENCVRQIRKNLKINQLKAEVFQSDIFSSFVSSKSFSKYLDLSRGTFLISKGSACLPAAGRGLGLEIERSPGVVRLFEKTLTGTLGKFDFILANPPYVSTAGRGSRVQTSASQYEPAPALWSGDDGLDIIRRFLVEAKQHLAPTGEIWLEFGVGQKTKIEKLIKAEGYKQYQFHRDQFGRFRFVVIR